MALAMHAWIWSVLSKRSTWYFFSQYYMYNSVILSKKKPKTEINANIYHFLCGQVIKQIQLQNPYCWSVQRLYNMFLNENIYPYPIEITCNMYETAGLGYRDIYLWTSSLMMWSPYWQTSILYNWHKTENDIIYVIAQPRKKETRKD